MKDRKKRRGNCKSREKNHVNGNGKKVQRKEVRRKV
jgi:hypothetical protein